MRNLGVFNVLKSVEKRLGFSELSVKSWVSAVEGCSLSGVPLYIQYLSAHAQFTFSHHLSLSCDFTYQA